MQATEDRPMTGGAGWRPVNPVSTEDIMDLLAMRRDEDPNGRKRDYWAIQIMNVSGLAELPLLVAMEYMQFVAAHNCVGLKRNRDYLIRAIDDAMDEGVV